MKLASFIPSFLPYTCFTCLFYLLACLLYWLVLLACLLPCRVVVSPTKRASAISRNITVMEVNVIETHKKRKINVCMIFGYVSDEIIDENDAPDTCYAY